MLRPTTGVVAIGALIAGTVFALQGLRVLPSRVMYGEPLWVIIGVVMDLGALVVLWRLRR